MGEREEGEVTRRKILAALLPLAVMARKVEAVDQEVVTTSIWRTSPSRVQFGLDSFTDYVFTLGDKKVTFTPQEIMQILESK